MAEKFTLLQDDPLKTPSNVLTIFFSSEEPTKLYKNVQSSYQILKSEDKYTFFHTQTYPAIVAIETDLCQSYQQYQQSFQVIIPWLLSNYGKILTLSFPECDNLQSMVMGLSKCLAQYTTQDVQFKLYAEESCRNIFKPVIESLQYSVKQNEMTKFYVLEYFKCSQCGKFPYVPMMKTCCEKIVCARCALRDVKSCVMCNTKFETRSPGAEIVQLCKSAPYLCKCNQTLPFADIDKHLQTCHAAEVECRVCNEMTKFSNFIAHFRMLHIDQVKELVNKK